MHESTRDVLVRDGGWLKIRGWSMWPVYRPGNLVEIEPSDNQRYVPGDVVAIFLNESICVHRLIVIDKNNIYRTAGDARLTADQTIASSQIIGRVKPSNSVITNMLNFVFSYITRLRFFLYL